MMLRKKSRQMMNQSKINQKWMSISNKPLWFATNIAKWITCCHNKYFFSHFSNNRSVIFWNDIGIFNFVFECIVRHVHDERIANFKVTEASKYSITKYHDGRRVQFAHFGRGRQSLLNVLRLLLRNPDQCPQ